MTRGYGIMNHTFDQYLPVIPGEIGGRHRGALVSIDNGKATTYSIMSIEERGTIFVNPGTEVYEGMIIGENSRENDLTVNITKAKQMTNVRSATKDQTAVIKTPRILTLEESLEFLNDDEYMEVTPESIRLRKQILNKAEREKANKRKNQQLLNNMERKEKQNGLFYLRDFDSPFTFYDPKSIRGTLNSVTMVVLIVSIIVLTCLAIFQIFQLPSEFFVGAFLAFVGYLALVDISKMTTKQKK